MFARADWSKAKSTIYKITDLVSGGTEDKAIEWVWGIRVIL
jgi:hypothetical protein